MQKESIPFRQRLIIGLLFVIINILGNDILDPKIKEEINNLRVRIAVADN